MGTAAPGLLAGGPFQADVGAGAGVRVGIQGVLAVVYERKVHSGLLLDGRGNGIQAAIAGGCALDRAAAAGDDDICRNAAVRVLDEVRVRHIERLDVVEVAVLKDAQHLFHAQLAVLVVADVLDAVAEVLAHLRRRIVAVVLLQQEADTALAALGVDADDVGIVGTTNVVWVNGDVRAGPLVELLFFAPGHALGDGVLMAAAERREHQCARIGRALIDVHPGHALIDLADGGHIAEIEVRVYAVAVHVHGQRNSIDVAGALTVAEQAALDALGTGQDGQLGVGNAAAAVIVRMGRQNNAVTIFQVFGAPLDLVGVDVRHAHLHRDRQVDDHGAVRRGLHDVENGVADLDSVFRLGTGEALGAVLEQEVALVLLAQLLDELGTIDGDLFDLLLRLFEYLLTLGDAGGVVEVDDGTGRTLDGLKRLADDVVAALGQDLHGHVLRDAVAVDQGAQELILGLAGSREADLDLFEADFDQHIVKFELFLQAHRHDEALVAVAQVHAAPGRGLLDMVLLGPLIDMAGLYRRRIIPYTVLGCVHHNKTASFKAFGSRFEGGIHKTVPQRRKTFERREQDQRCCTRGTTLIAVKQPLCTISPWANRACMITVRFRPRLPVSAAAPGPVYSAYHTALHRPAAL